MALRADKADGALDRAAWLHRRRQHWQLVEPSEARALPLVPPSPRPTIYFSIAFLVAVLPGLYALQYWDLTPPGPWWGMRGLAVLEGHVLDQVPLSGLGPAAEADAYRRVAMQPPLYAWLEAAALGLSGTRNPLATVVPSYAAGALAVLFVFGIGRLWGGPALGMLAAVLMAFNVELLVPMQHATPATTGLGAILGSLWCYSHSCRARRLPARAGFALGSGLATGLALLSVGPIGLCGFCAGLLHQLILGCEVSSRAQASAWERLVERVRERRRDWCLAVATLLAALATSAPWFVWMHGRYGAQVWDTLVTPAAISGQWLLDRLNHLLLLAPATLALALLGVVRAARRVAALRGGARDPESRGAALWVAWLMVAVGAPFLFSENTAALSRMFLAVPLSLLAARTIIELATRRLSSRALIGLAPATALLLLWWWLPELRAAFEGMLHRRSFSPGMSLALHLGLDLVVLMALAIHVFNGWASANDQRRRYLIGAFLLGVLCMTIAPGLREVSFRHRETTDVLSLREAIVQRQARRPLDLLAVVSTDDDPTAASDTRQGPMPQPGGRLRFILRSAVPHLTQIDVATVQQLQDLPENERVVVLAGTGLRLSYTMQSRLRLEVLYPGNSGLLAAYSTPVEPPRRVARR